MENTKRTQIPSFGDWNYYNEIPMQAGLVRGTDNDLFYVSSPVKPKIIKQGCVEKQRKQATIKPVDEDLYKIPPELLHEKPKRRNFLRSLLTGCGCLCLNCVA